MKSKTGIICGTGLGKIFHIFQNSTDKHVSTPFGMPSDTLREGFINDIPCAVLHRHGKDHNINPSNINYRANLWSLKEVGCTHVLAVTSCGGLQQNTKPGDLVIIDQFFDNTYRRDTTFYDGQPNSPKGVLHIPMNQPFCEKTRQILIRAIHNRGGEVHESGTVVTIEGPRFSSKYESKYWNKMGATVVNMTTVPEVILAKELGLCYASLGMVTDVDSWLEMEELLDVQQIGAVVKSKADFVKDVLIEAVKIINSEDWSDVFYRNQKLIESSLV